MKLIESTGKELLSTKNIISEKMLNPEILNELENIEQEQKINQKKYSAKNLKLCVMNIIVMDVANDELEKLKSLSVT